MSLTRPRVALMLPAMRRIVIFALFSSALAVQAAPAVPGDEMSRFLSEKGLLGHIEQVRQTVSEKASEKVRLLEQFERLEQERRQLCTQAGMPPMEAGSQSGASRAFAQRWKSLMGLLAHCRNANETNGLILNLKQGQVRQLLDILRGGPAITYGPNGQTFAAAVRPIARV